MTKENSENRPKKSNYNDIDDSSPGLRNLSTFQALKEGVCNAL